MSAPLVHRHRPADGPPEGALVLLHGRGADEHDLLPLADALDPARRLHVVTPGGPLALPPGGRHWYVVPRVGFPDPATFAESYGRLERFLDALPETLGVPWERTVLGGFSQGAVMSYALGLGEGRPSPAGVLGLSGFVPEVDGWAPDLASRAGLPVWTSHGAADPVIPVGFARRARDLLAPSPVELTYHEGPGVPHTIDPRLLPDLRAWLAAALARERV